MLVATSAFLNLLFLLVSVVRYLKLENIIQHTYIAALLKLKVYMENAKISYKDPFVQTDCPSPPPANKNSTNNKRVEDREVTYISEPNGQVEKYRVSPIIRPTRKIRPSVIFEDDFNVSPTLKISPS